MATITVDTRLVPVKQYVAPVTGATVAVNTDGYINLLINPAGTLATLTITVPASPTDGDRVRIGATQIVTALTMNGGTIVGALVSLAVGGFATYVYNSDSVKWLRVG